ncbi:MAG: diguanylate cyclase [Cyanobacteria bacterium SW_9_44_58]|nr:MAG: diguanylate cyclase [Cyanobacteria bacterium SW_9_44_58]
MTRESNILAVDDTPENLLLLCDLLEERGYKVHLASDGELVLNNIFENPPELILLDIRLSGIDGYEVCQKLKSDPKTQHIPIIFLSFLEDPKVKVQAFKVGGSDYITKPFQEEEVIARIENHLMIQQQKQELEKLQTQLLDKNQILEQQNRHLQLLVTLSEVMNRAETIEGAIAPVLSQICQVIDWDYGEAWILNREGTTLERSNHWYASHPNFNWHETYTDESIVAAQTELVYKIAQSQQIEWIANVSQLNEFNLNNDCQLLQNTIQKMGLTSILGIPIVFKDQVLAVLMFLSDCSGDQQQGASFLTLSPDWLNLMKSVATQLGTLMQRLRTEQALKEANAQLQHLATSDGLTAIANRRRFDEYFDELWRQGKRDRQELSLILCDLDAFKVYNDCFGHQAGDQCLQQVASAIVNVVKRPLDLVARYGGEELAVLLPYTAQIGAFQIAEQIREAVKALKLPHPHSPVSNIVTVSVGISSMVPRADCSPKTLIEMADHALYQAKALGRDRVFLNNQFSEQASSNIEGDSWFPNYWNFT